MSRERIPPNRIVCCVVAAVVAGLPAAYADDTDNSKAMEVITSLSLSNDYARALDYFPNGDVLLKANKNTAEGEREQSLYRVYANGQAPEELNYEVSDPEIRVSFSDVRIGPEGLAVARRCRELGTREVRDSETGEAAIIRAEPILDVVLLNLTTGEQRVLPSSIADYAWIDERHLLVFYNMEPRTLGVFDVSAWQTVHKIGAPLDVMSLQQVGPGLAAYQTGPDPNNPHPYDLSFLALQEASTGGDPSAYLKLGAAVSQAYLDCVEQMVPVHQYVTHPSGPIHLVESTPPGEPSQWAVVPFESNDYSYGQLHLLSFAEGITSPTDTVLMAPFQNNVAVDLSPDGRYVAYNRMVQTDKGFSTNLVVYDTQAREWKPLGPAVKSLMWSPAGDRLLCTSEKQELHEIALAGSLTPPGARE